MKGKSEDLLLLFLKAPLRIFDDVDDNRGWHIAIHQVFFDRLENIGGQVQDVECCCVCSMQCTHNMTHQCHCQFPPSISLPPVFVFSIQHEAASDVQQSLFISIAFSSPHLKVSLNSSCLASRRSKQRELPAAQHQSILHWWWYLAHPFEKTGPKNQ